MNTDAVIGCDAIDVGDEWLRLSTASGAVRTIPWTAIRLAGMGAKLEGHVTIQGVTEKLAPYRLTHDSLWIAYGEGGFVEAMIEKTSPLRDALLNAFERHLGERWRGTELTEVEMSGAMLIPPKLRIPKATVAMLAAMAILFFLAIAIAFFTHGAKPTAP